MDNGKSSMPADIGARTEYDAPPSYEEYAGPFDSVAGSSNAPPPPSASGGSVGVGSIPGPTVDSPFNFPSGAAPLPPYEAGASNSSSSAVGPFSSSADPGLPAAPPPLPQNIIAIPQIRVEPTAPFLDAYQASLLKSGIPSSTWQSFLETMSAFLSAKVSDRAVAHAGDVWKELSRVPKTFGKDTADHVKSVGKNISDRAKKGNVVGAAVHAIGGTINVPVATILRLTGAAATLSFLGAGTMAWKPKTPLERANAYLAVANRDWFHPRNLHAVIVDTGDLLAYFLNGALAVDELVDSSRVARKGGAGAQLERLEEYTAKLEIRLPVELDIGASTLWLVMTPRQGQGKGAETGGKGKRKGSE